MAARYLGVAPWDLAERPEFWMNWALSFRQAEMDAIPIAQKIQEQRAKMNGGQDED